MRFCKIQVDENSPIDECDSENIIRNQYVLLKTI